MGDSFGQLSDIQPSSNRAALLGVFKTSYVACRRWCWEGPFLGTINLSSTNQLFPPAFQFKESVPLCPGSLSLS